MDTFPLPLQKVNVQEKPLLRAMPATGDAAWPSSPDNLLYDTQQSTCLQGNQEVQVIPESSLSRNAASKIKQKHFPKHFCTLVRSAGIYSGDLFTPFCEMLHSCNGRSGFVKFFFAGCQQHFN